MKEREELNKNILDQMTSLKLSDDAQKAFDRFKLQGLPHKKLEDYKYTNVDAFFPKALNIKAVPGELSKEQVSKLARGVNPQLVLINGKVSNEYSKLPEGVEFQITDSFTGNKDFPTDSLEDLNLILSEQFIKLTIKKDSSPGVINILHLNTTEALNSVGASRLLVNIEANSVARIAEYFNSPEQGSYNRNHLTEISVAENANAEHVKVVTEGAESFHFGSVKATVEANACLHSFTFTTGGKLSRNNINIDLVGVGARGEVNGLYALRGSQQCDNFSHINHKVERTESEQLFKAVLDDVSHGIFTGKIIVHRDAQLVDSSQLNKNLLLSKKAHADSRPQLEVYADDVKCAHGATVGQLSEEELFYLESRAISPRDAKIMLCHGFVQEALDKIKHVETKKYLENLLYTEYEKDIHQRMREEA